MRLSHAVAHAAPCEWPMRVHAGVLAGLLGLACCLWGLVGRGGVGGRCGFAGVLLWWRGLGVSGVAAWRVLGFRVFRLLLWYGH